MQLLLSEHSFPRVAAWLAEHAPNIDPILMHADGACSLRGAAFPETELKPEIAWANTDVFFGPARNFMVACLKSSRLRWVQSSAAGFDHPVFGMLADKGVMLTNTDAASIAIAEFVLADVLACFHPVGERQAAQRERHWQRLAFREIAATTWLVVGMGNIGAEVAKRAKAFGAHVIGVRRNPQAHALADESITPKDLLSVVERCDVVVLCAASNADSHRLVNAQFLERMRRRSVLVNVARGALVDEAALLPALDRGIPEHAILDVFETEPLLAESLLWSHPRVRVTAHCAAAGEGLVARADAIFLRNLGRFVRDEPLERVVDAAEIKRSLPGNKE